MPAYEYRCNKCKEKFVVTMSLKEKENKKITCPKCNSDDVTQIFTSFYAKTDKKSW